MHRLIDKVGVPEISKKINVTKITIYFWLYREANIPGQASRGVGKDKFTKLIALAKAHKVRGMTAEYLTLF